MAATVAIVPALDEAECIGPVVLGLLPHVDRIVVVDNGSRDATGQVAAAAGALVVVEPRRGYGAACLAGVRAARVCGADVLLFADADGSDDPAQAPLLLEPVRAGRADLVLGVRRPETIAAGAMTAPQQLGNWIAPRAMRWLTGARYADMPPFKAVSRAAFDTLGVSDTGHGFTIELLLRAHARRLRVEEVPVTCRPRAAGRSKVSGTLAGTVRAGAKILFTIGRHGLRARLRA